MTHENYKEQLKRIVLDEQTFVRLTMKGKLRGHGRALPWRQIIVRPVLIKNERNLQFSYFTEKQDITKNYLGYEASEQLDEILALPFSSISVQSIAGDMHVQISKKGKAIIQRNSAPIRPANALCASCAQAGRKEKDVTSRRKVELAHDLSKQLPLPADKPDAFLQTIGIMDEQGRVRASMQGKFAQINEFLKLLEHTGELDRFEKRPVNILDCGCGSAYLSFATYHYLDNVRGIPARLIGIDVNETLIEKDNALCEQLGFSNACFQKSAIIDYKPEQGHFADTQPDIVLALHACDTATDEAIAQGIAAQARLILCAPCCHHDLNRQLQAVGPFNPVFRHGILKERMADILTDTFRALILRIMGYKTDVVEFVSTEHTDKNLMIRAVKRGQQDTAQFVQEYYELKKYWGVTPYLETLVGERLLTPRSSENSRT